MAKSTTVTVAEILAVHSAEVRAICERLRGLVRSAMPDVIERPYPGWHAVGFRHPKAGYVCGMFPFERSVRFVFEHGIELRDPERLLTGDGKQVRYIDFEAADAIPADGLAVLIVEAVALRT